jgi:hypothetical protein
VNRHPAERFITVVYTVTKVWPGIANTGLVAEKFIRYDEVTKWAREHYPKVPLIRNY